MKKINCFSFVLSQILHENANTEKGTESNLYMSRIADSLTSTRRKRWLLSLPTNQIISCLIMSSNHRRLIKKILCEKHELMYIDSTFNLIDFLNSNTSTTRIECEIQATYPYNFWLLKLLTIDDELGIKLDSKHKIFAKSLCIRTFPSHYIPKRLLVYIESLL